VENDITINNNLSVDHIRQQFVTFIRVFQLEHRHPWTKERLVGHKTPQVTLIIPCEVQTGETQRHTNNLQQNSRREERRIENANSHIEFRQRSRC